MTTLLSDEKDLVLFNRHMLKEALELFEKFTIGPGFIESLKFRDMELKLIDDSGLGKPIGKQT